MSLSQSCVVFALLFAATFLANVFSILVAYRLEDRRARQRRRMCEICGTSPAGVTTYSIDEDRNVRSVSLCQTCHIESATLSDRRS